MSDLKVIHETSNALALTIKKISVTHILRKYTFSPPLLHSETTEKKNLREAFNMIIFLSLTHSLVDVYKLTCEHTTLK